MSILNVLINFYSDNTWTLSGDTYDGLEWLDNSTPKPSEADLIAKSDDAQTVETSQAQINVLKEKLTATDYVAMSDYDQDKTDVKTQRQQWRTEIRTLQATINSLRGEE